MEEVLRKYLRYALNEKPFNPEVILDLIHLRRVSMLEDAQVAEVLNEISRRIVREKGMAVLILCSRDSVFLLLGTLLNEVLKLNDNKLHP